MLNQSAYLSFLTILFGGSVLCGLDGELALRPAGAAAMSILPSGGLLSIFLQCCAGEAAIARRSAA